MLPGGPRNPCACTTRSWSLHFFPTSVMTMFTSKFSLWIQNLNCLSKCECKCAANKLETTTRHSGLRKIHFESEIVWRRPRLPAWSA